ncbi:MAG: excinuclease ABC subunit C [Bacteroidetes bacterium HGW-Bacteroidetes-21]|jgi:putative endonuclease|nr:MAG: excinuclease ABC subunit C [Bacteroidetes bacterium HGW-Bacteroidetes-21]
MSFITYILQSKTNSKFYCGITNDICKRQKEHNEGKCSSTKSAMPWDVVFQTKFNTREEARALEVKIKGRGAKRFLEDLRHGSAFSGINSVG